MFTTTPDNLKHSLLEGLSLFESDRSLSLSSNALALAKLNELVSQFSHCHLFNSKQERESVLYSE